MAREIAMHSSIRTRRNSRLRTVVMPRRPDTYENATRNKRKRERDTENLTYRVCISRPRIDAPRVFNVGFESDSGRDYQAAI